MDVCTRIEVSNNRFRQSCNHQYISTDAIHHRYATIDNVLIPNIIEGAFQSKNKKKLASCFKLEMGQWNLNFD